MATYTDLLIAPVDEDDYFSQPGDSGKMVFTNDLSVPIGLLWGGSNLRSNMSRELVDHSFAINIADVLDELGVDLLSAAP